MRPELIVAEKEFKDHLTSKRFIAIFAILILLSLLGMVNGMGQYNKALDAYKLNQTVNQQQGMTSPAMPSVLYVFGDSNDGSGLGGGFFSIILMLLAMALGFDLITREKEEGSLKSLLSHPVYRDSVINGKLIGAMASLVVVMGSVFIVTLAVMMFYGVVPTADDLWRLGAYFVMALLFCSVFFGIATLFSTVARTSTMSILCVMGVMVALVVFPSFAPDIANAIMGPAPAISNVHASEAATSVNNSANGATSSGTTLLDPAYQQYYYNRWKLTDTIDTISPIYNFGSRISTAIMYRQSGSMGQSLNAAASTTLIRTEPTLLDSLAYVWVNILALIIELAVPIAVTYIMFMRMDVR